jgi:glycosyltransferase involved in cell wall biosynthesis
MAVFTRDWETTQPLRWGDYAPASLAAAMQYAYAHPEEVLERGAAARLHVCRELSWKKVYASMRERLVALSADSQG